MLYSCAKSLCRVNASYHFHTESLRGLREYFQAFIAHSSALRHKSAGSVSAEEYQSLGQCQGYSLDIFLIFMQTQEKM